MPSEGRSDSLEFFAGFIDDYFAESDEHLSSIRHALLDLDASLGQPDMASPAIEELFRSVHSLKGLSGMVELRPAEQLTHEMESYLRGLQQREVALTRSGIEALIDGINTFEQIIAARRAERPTPDITAPLARIAALVTAVRSERRDIEGAVVGTGPGSTPATADADFRGRTWKFTFEPSAALVARGVKVDTIRARLAQLGRILSVSPKITSGGGIAFEFLVATEADEEKLATFGEDGVTFEVLHPAVAADADAAREAHVASSEAHVTLLETASVAAPTHFVRVDLARLDELMRLVADLVVTRARLDDQLSRVERSLPATDARALQEHAATMDRHLRDLREGIMRVRLVRVGEIFRRMPFAVRDLARDTNKRVRVELRGEATEIDKFLVERMMDPILHLVRNAVSHGIESPEDRIAVGKPPDATILLKASTAGESVVLEVIDDGAGIDTGKVMERARAAGFPVPEGTVDAGTLLGLICAPGFSTRQETDRASGRGVGMAVVRKTVQELGGTLALESNPGRGTAFKMSLPLTLAITDALIATVDRDTFAIPQGSVREVIEIDPASIRRVENNELITHRGAALPLLRLGRLFGVTESSRPRLHAFVVGTGLAAVGIVVDRIVGQREIVVKTITDSLIKVDGVSGATELGNGRVVLILDAVALAASARVDGRRHGDAGGARAATA